MLRSKIGERILASGLRKGFIAEKLGVNKNTVSNWIKGTTWPDLDQAYLLAKLLNCKMDDLIEEIAA